jgi:hypothetical protein
MTSGVASSSSSLPASSLPASASAEDDEDEELDKDDKKFCEKLDWVEDPVVVETGQISNWSSGCDS